MDVNSTEQEGTDSSVMTIGLNGEFGAWQESPKFIQMRRSTRRCSCLRVLIMSWRDEISIGGKQKWHQLRNLHRPMSHRRART